MWLFEKRGFVSVVAYDPKLDSNKQSNFRNIAKQAGTHLLVRARVEADLDWLKITVPSLQVETDNGADYAFRAVITRKQFKQALAKSVDEIDYGSHFKEVARDNSPKAEGRYSAMMSVWSAMIKLQPFTPWSGGSYSSWGSGGSGKGSSSSWWSSKEKSTPTVHGTKDVEEFLDEYAAGEDVSYKGGGGPRTGFKEGDRVVGYIGAGVVVNVESKANGAADTVRVKLDKDKRITNVVSNFLMPEDLPEIVVPEVTEDDGDYDLDWMYETALTMVREKTRMEDFSTDLLRLLDDDAFELLTRLQEHEDRGETVNDDLVNETHDEVLWEISDGKKRVEIWQDAASVPRKHEAAAAQLFSSLEISEK